MVLTEAIRIRRDHERREDTGVEFRGKVRSRSPESSWDASELRAPADKLEDLCPSSEHSAP